MDLKTQKENRQARINAKKEAIRAQAESAPATEAEAVAEVASPEEKK